MVHLLGLVLALVLAGLVVTALVVAWRRPYLGLPILVGGMAVHNAALMFLLTAAVPDTVVRCLQLWKEALLVLLALKLVDGLVRSGLHPGLSRALDNWRSTSLAVRVLDAGVALFAVMLVVYTVAPVAVGDSQASLAQRLLELRQLELIPLLYLFGRTWPPVDFCSGLGLIVAVSVLVSAMGLLELFFIPTRSWLDLGILRFDSWLGYHYSGPGGLPENFFQTTSDGLLRRMVSTYLSPLGIAYTGILVIPIAFIASISSLQRIRYAWLALVLVLVGVSFSLTRLALLCILVEAVVLVVVMRRRAGFLAAGVIVAATAFGLLVYPSFGPIVGWSLEDIRPPIGAQILTFDSHGGQPGSLSTDVLHRLATGDDASIQGHISAVQNDLRFISQHPIGVGLGTSITRYGTASGPGESALFALGADIGVAGLVLFSMLYGGLVLAGLIVAWRRREELAESALGVVVGVGGLALIPVVITSQVWGDFSVTFLFWWAAGSVVTVVAGQALAQDRRGV